MGISRFRSAASAEAVSTVEDDHGGQGAARHDGIRARPPPRVKTAMLPSEQSANDVGAVVRRSVPTRFCAAAVVATFRQHSVGKGGRYSVGNRRPSVRLGVPKVAQGTTQHGTAAR